MTPPRLDWSRSADGCTSWSYDAGDYLGSVTALTPMGLATVELDFEMAMCGMRNDERTRA